MVATKNAHLEMVTSMGAVQNHEDEEVDDTDRNKGEQGHSK